MPECSHNSTSLWGFSHNRMHTNSYKASFFSSKKKYSVHVFLLYTFSFWFVFQVIFWQLRKPYVWKGIWEVDFSSRRWGQEMHQSLLLLSDSSSHQRHLINFNHCHNCKGHTWDWKHKSATTLKHKWVMGKSVCVHTYTCAYETMHFTKTPSKCSTLFSV